MMAILIQEHQERVKRMLLKEKKELENHLRGHLANTMKEGQALFASSVRDEGDLGHFGFEQEMSRWRVNSCSEKLAMIEEALARLNCADYGICEECGSEISERRLQAMPFTLHCRECQENLEDGRSSEKSGTGPKESSAALSYRPEADQ
jgi:DnaK suppressor protein